MNAGDPSSLSFIVPSFRFKKATLIFCFFVYILILAFFSLSLALNDPTEQDIEDSRMHEEDPPQPTSCMMRYYVNTKIRNMKPQVKPLSLSQSRNRVLLSSTTLSSGDGVGHFMAMLNFELNFALKYNLTYSHRVSSYSSLTVDNNHSVEDFFGWGDNEIHRDRILSQACHSSINEKNCPRCESLKSTFGDYDSRFSSPRFDFLVNIPWQFFVSCQKTPNKEGCVSYAREFFSKYDKPNTLFQLPNDFCHSEAYSHFDWTRYWFVEKYWNKHISGKYIDEQNRRVLSDYDVKRVNVAMHIRRGDFFRYRHRVLIADRVYANVFKSLVRYGELESTMNITVHIYSEGHVEKEAYTHDIRKMLPYYRDENGESRDLKYWQDLLAVPGYSVDVKLHIAEDTIKSLHHMVAADVFIGSQSGLSTSTVASLSRGLVVLPSGNLKRDDLMPYNVKTGEIRRDAARFRWQNYISSVDLSCTKVEMKSTP